MGNHRIRTTVVESCQKSSMDYRVSKTESGQERSTERDCRYSGSMHEKRLRNKSLRLQHVNKHINKVKVASARELLCFTREALMAVA